MHSDKKRSKRKGSKDDTPNRLALPKASKNLLGTGRLEAECEEALERLIAESEHDTGGNPDEHQERIPTVRSTYQGVGRRAGPQTETRVALHRS
jgi:hypothetical protein